jgi:hypothetical protein
MSILELTLVNSNGGAVNYDLMMDGRRRCG